VPLITYTSVCTSKNLIAREVYELTFTRPAEFTFKPGQFILFDVPLPPPPAPSHSSSLPLGAGRGGAENVQTRALSIASLPSEDNLLFIVKLLPGGRLSRWVEETLTEGSTAAFKGPFGNFVLNKTPTPAPVVRLRCGAGPQPPPPPFDRLREGEGGAGSFLFIATGAGIAPFRPMVIEAAQKFPERRIDVLFGVRSEEDLFWTPHQNSLRSFGAGQAPVLHPPDFPSTITLDFARGLPNVFVHIALSQPLLSWTGHRGRVQTVAPQIVGNTFTGKALYVCGNPDMTTDVKRLALEEWNVDKQDLHVEGYI